MNVSIRRVLRWASRVSSDFDFRSLDNLFSAEPIPLETCVAKDIVHELSRFRSKLVLMAEQSAEEYLKDIARSCMLSTLPNDQPSLDSPEMQSIVREITNPADLDHFFAHKHSNTVSSM